MNPLTLTKDEFDTINRDQFKQPLFNSVTNDRFTYMIVSEGYAEELIFPGAESTYITTIKDGLHSYDTLYIHDKTLNQYYKINNYETFMLYDLIADLKNDKDTRYDTIESESYYSVIQGKDTGFVYLNLMNDRLDKIYEAVVTLNQEDKEDLIKVLTDFYAKKVKYFNDTHVNTKIALMKKDVIPPLTLVTYFEETGKQLVKVIGRDRQTCTEQELDIEQLKIQEYLEQFDEVTFSYQLSDGSWYSGFDYDELEHNLEFIYVCESLEDSGFNVVVIPKHHQYAVYHNDMGGFTAVSGIDLTFYS